MNKYEWSNVPSHIMWIATDKDGVSNGFENKPLIVDRHKMWFDGDDWYPIDHLYKSLKSNWQDSLEERPND